MLALVEMETQGDTKQQPLGSFWDLLAPGRCLPVLVVVLCCWSCCCHAKFKISAAAQRQHGQTVAKVFAAAAKCTNKLVAISRVFLSAFFNGTKIICFFQNTFGVSL